MKEHTPKEHQKRSEPNISELEKTVHSFRSAHGESKLMEHISDIINVIMQPNKKKSAIKKDEPKISELESIMKAFKNVHGHEKLMDSVKTMDKKNVVNKKVEQEKKIVPKVEMEEVPNTPKDIVYHAKKTTRQRIKRKDFKGTFVSIKNTWKLKRYRYPVIVFAVFMGIFILFNIPTMYARLSWKKTEIPKTTVRTEEIVQKKMADSATLSPGEVIPTESRVVISKINVNVPIVYPESYDEKVIQEELHRGVVHYKGTAKPGEVGNSFITGHSSNYWWDTGKYNYAFVLLDKLEVGDKATIYYNGKKYVYTVRDKVVTSPSDMSVTAPTDTPTLSLMTCTPPGTSWKRLVVRFDITDPVYYKPEKVIKERQVETPQPKKEESFIQQVFSFFTPN